MPSTSELHKLFSEITEMLTQTLLEKVQSFRFDFVLTNTRKQRIPCTMVPKSTIEHERQKTLFKYWTNLAIFNFVILGKTLIFFFMNF